jgi:hypothetical protein
MKKIGSIRWRRGCFEIERGNMERRALVGSDKKSHSVLESHPWTWIEVYLLSRLQFYLKSRSGLEDVTSHVLGDEHDCDG